tara:strand:- start:201 stop:1532 length:1332 start_codon:yes stop_codon:yes gene_type:complete
MQSNFLEIKETIKTYDKQIFVDGDKSISIRWALLASQAIGTSTAQNLLNSEDVLNTLKCLKKLGIKILLKGKICKIYGAGLNGFDFKKNLILNAGNSGTLGRLILPLLIKSPFKIKLVGDKSLSKRDFSRIIEPLKEVGVNFYPKNKTNLPIFIKGNNYLRPINYLENRGSAQCKSSIMLASLFLPGQTNIIAKKSRDHTEIMFKNLNIPIKIKKKLDYDLISLLKPEKIKKNDINIPGDISSSAFFIVLTLLSKNSKLIIQNVNINPSRTGVIKILNEMGARIKLLNKRKINNEECADIFVKGQKKIKKINCHPKLNSSAIDEFLIIFLVAAKAYGVSTFRNLSELNQKESPRLKIATKILKMMGVKVISDNNSIKIFGNPKLQINKKIEIKNYMKDHRVFMMSVIAALSFGGNWKIFDPESVKTSFPSFMKIIYKLNGKVT